MARNRLVLILAFASLLFAVPALRAQVPVDVSGTWDLQTDVFVAQPEGQAEGLPDCQYEGSAEIGQDGSSISGSSDLSLVSGDPPCPAEMSADLTGTVAGSSIEMGMLMGGNLGSAQFTGTVVESADGGNTGGGFFVDSGPFSGSDGTWTAQRGAAPVLAIPTLTTIGLVVLVALLLGAAALLLRRRGAVEA